MKSLSNVLTTSPIIPVIVIDEVDVAVDLAICIKETGIDIIEITLRTPAALEAIERIRTDVDIHVGAGTITSVQDMQQALDVGSEFLFSPGITKSIVNYAKEKEILLVPGVFTPSEVMLAMTLDVRLCKLFPANKAGGVSTLKLFHTLFKNMQFCPTGGINFENIVDYLSLPNVATAGGSFIASSDLIKNRDFKKIQTNIERLIQLTKQGK